MSRKQTGSQKDILTILSIAIGAISLILAFLDGIRFFSLPLGIVGIVLAIIVLRRKQKAQRTLALVGLGISFLSIPAAYGMTYLTYGTFNGVVADKWTTVQLGSLEYSIPANWEKKEENGAIDLSQGTVNIRLSSGSETADNAFAASLQKSMVKGELFRAMLQTGITEGLGASNVTINQPEESTINGNEADTWTFTASKDGKKMEGRIVVLFVGNQMTMAMIGQEGNLHQAYLDTFNRIVASAKLTESSSTSDTESDVDTSESSSQEPASKWNEETKTLTTSEGILKIDRVERTTSYDGKPAIKFYFTVTNNSNREKKAMSIFSSMLDVRQKNENTANKLDVAVLSGDEENHMLDNLVPGGTVSGFYPMKLEDPNAPLDLRFKEDYSTIGSATYNID